MEPTFIEIEIDGRVYQGQVAIQNGIVTVRTDRTVTVVYMGDAANAEIARDLLVDMIERSLTHEMGQSPPSSTT